MIYKNQKTGYWHTRLKGEAEALFKTKREAEEYTKNHAKWQQLKEEEHNE